MGTMDRAPDAVTPEALLAEAPWVRRLAGALVGDPAFADDVAQETLRRGLEHPPTSRAGLRGWLATVARNVVRSRFRADRRRTGREQAVARPEGGSPVDDVVARAEEHRRVVEAVLTLEEPYRSTILHRYFDDLGPTAIAERTGTPVDTVRTRLNRALGQLRGRLEAEHGGDPAATRRALLALLGPAAGTATPTAPDRDPTPHPAPCVGAPPRLVPWFAAAALVAGGGTLLLRSAGDTPTPGTVDTPVAAAPPSSGRDGEAPGAEGDPATRLAAGGTSAIASPRIGGTPAARVTGIVVDEQGAPVPGVLVLARAWSAPGAPTRETHPLRLQRLRDLGPLSPPLPARFRTTSDATGTFSLDVDGVAPDGYVTLIAMPSAPSVGSTRMWSVSTGGEESLTLRVARGAPLQGRLLDAAGHGIAATVTLERRVPGERDPWRWTGIAAAGEDGRFTLDAAPLGSLSIDVRAPGRLGVNDHLVEHRAGEEVVLTIGGAPGAAVVGTVTDGAGAPVPNADVLVYTKVDGTPNEWRNVAARTGPDGAYRVEGLAACLLSTLLVDAEGYAPISILRNTPLPAGGTERWDVRLFRGAAIEGRVLGEDGSPIEGATFVVRYPGIQPPPLAREVRSNAEGRFVLEGLALGEAEWRVRADGWYDAVREGMRPPTNRSWEPVGRTLRFETEGERRHLDVPMKRGIPVRGTVVDAAGRPVAGAQVVVTYEPRPGENDGGAEPSTRSAADGGFTFPGLTPARGARLHAAAPHARTAKDVPVLDGPGTRDVVLTMVATGRILGRVVDERGEGLPNVQVGRDGTPPGPFTDATGAFRLNDVPEGPHEIHVLDGQSRPRGERVAVTVPPGGDALGVELRVPDATRLRGVVVDAAGAPVAQAMVSALPAGVVTDSWLTTTDGRGEFQFFGLPPGAYRLHFDDPGDAVPATTGSLDLRLVKTADRGRKLTGAILDADGRPVPSARLAVGCGTALGTTWNVHPVGGGRFEVAVPTTDPTVTVEAYDASDESGRRLPLRPWRGERVDLRVPLTIRMETGRRLTGRVLDAAGVGAEGVDVSVRSQVQGVEPRPFMTATPTTRTDGEGRFAFEGLLEGEILLSVETGAGRPAVPDVRVAAGQNEGEIRLPSPASVSGRVLDDQGRPMSGVEVSADSEHRYPGRWNTTTDTEGRFRMENLPASAEQIRVWLPTPQGRGTDWPWLADPAVETRPGARDVVVKLERGVFVEGTLLDERDRPAEGRVLALWDPPEAASGTNPGMRTITGSWPADPKTGRFAAGPIRPGMVRLVGEGVPGSRTESDVVPVAAPSRDVRLVLRPLPPVVPR